MRIVCLLVCLAACAAQPLPPAAAPTPEVAEPELPGWLLGSWLAQDGSLETWLAADRVYWGVHFREQSFEVLRIDRHDGKLRLTVWPDGKARASFYGSIDTSENTLRFERESAEFPEVLSYSRSDNTLRAFAAQDDVREDSSFGRVESEPAPWLEQADRDFARDTAARGAEGWTSWFAPEGALWRGGRVEGHEAVQAAISETFGNDSFRLSWAPTASGTAPSRALGFTVGTWTGQARADDDTFEPRGSGSYLTIWGRQPDGTYRVLFDLGSES